MKNIIIFAIIFFGVSVFSFSQNGKEENPFRQPGGNLIKQFEFPINRAVSITSDGDYFYMGIFGDPTFQKLDINGNQIGSSFTISGINGAYTLTYDGRYVWSARLSSVIHKIDMQANPPVRVEHIIAPVFVDHITFDQSLDDGAGGFWVGTNNNNDLIMINMSGTEIGRIPADTHGLHKIMATALDNVSIGGPYLWTICSRAYTPARICQIKLPEGESTGKYFDLYEEGYIEFSDEGSGIIVMNDLVPETTTLVVQIEGRKVLGFDMSGFYTKEHDIGVWTIEMPDYISNEADYEVKGRIRNFGSVDITSFNIHYSIDGGETQTYEVSDVLLEACKQIEFTHPILVNPVPGNHVIKLWTSLPNGNEDEFQQNDSKEFLYIVYDVNATVPRTILIESFSSVTCDPCAPTNVHFKAVLEENEGPYAVIKYQTNWPGVGDPYYTREVGTRVAYYYIGGVPTAVFEGWAKIHPINVDNSMIIGFQDNFSIMELESEYFVRDQTVYTKTKINSLLNMSGEVSLYTAIVENRTERNSVVVPASQSNGEKEFFHVFKKFIPDDKGVTINSLSAYTPFEIEQEWEFKGEYRLPGNANNPINHAIEHSVEDFGNLSVAVWVQNDQDKTVYQTTNAILSHATVNFITVNEYGNIFAYQDGNQIEQGDLLKAKSEVTFVAIPAEDYEVKEWKLNNITQENNSEELVITLERNSIATVEFQPRSRIHSNLSPEIKLFPNPVNNSFTVSNSENINKITIANLLGQTVKELNFNKINSIVVDTTDLPAGVYIITLYENDGKKGEMRIGIWDL